MENKDISKILSEISVYMQLLDENVFKIRAYENAARAVETYTGRVQDLEIKELQKIKGIGKAISEKIFTLSNSGELPYLEELRSRLPKGLIEILGIPGLGPKKAKVLYEKLNVTSMKKLMSLCKKEKVRELDGFGEQTEKKIIEGINLLKTFTGKHLLAHVLIPAEEVVKYLKKSKHVIRIEVAGSVRRRKKVVKDFDIIASSKNPEEVMNHFVKAGGVTEVIAKGKTKTSVIIDNKIQADLRVVKDVEFPYALHHFTGSKAHNIKMRGMAKDIGLKISEYGVFDGKKRIAAKDEKAFFKIFGLDYIPPELREDRGEIEAAASKKIPALIKSSDIKGIIHCHTSWSDGAGDLETMVIEAKKRGYSYIAITDHSKAAFYANGLDEKRLAKQVKEIEKLNKKIKGITILTGSEVDILGEGQLDFSDEILSKLDVVIAAVHSRFKMSSDEMTARLVRAIENPHVDILAHPTGRMLLTRDSYDFDWDKVLEAAVNTGTVIELNADPRRLDIDPVQARRAAEMGIKISINPDAHRITGLDNVQYGVYSARRAWLTKKNIFNAQDLKTIKK